MTRISFMLALAFFGIVPTVWPQSKTTVPPSRETLPVMIETRQRDWSQLNAVLLEAVRRLNPCSPRLASLVTQVRESAAALAEANARYFSLLLNGERHAMEEDRKFLETAAAGTEELASAASLFEQEREAVAAKRKQLPASAPDDIAAALAKLETTGQAGNNPAAEANAERRMRDNLANKESLLRQLEEDTAAELKRWNAYYDGIAAGLQRQCSGSQPSPAKPARSKPRSR